MGMIPENKLDAAPEDRNSEDLLRSRTLRVTGVGGMEEPTGEDTPGVEYSVDNVQLGCVYDVLDSNHRWCEGEIIKIDKRGGRVYVSYIYWESEYDEWVDNLAVRIAPKHQHTYIEGGRLKLGQRIEAIDERGEWLQAFVVEEDTDRVCVHYKGFAPKFDRWIRREEAPGNVRPFGRMRFQLRYLNASRRRDFLKNSNTKWSVPGMSTGLARATRLSAAAAAAAAAASSASSSSSASSEYDECKDGRICCVEDADRTRQIAELSDKFQQYVSALERHALRIVRVAGDGNCLFRAVAHQIYGDESLHSVVRAKCMEYMEAEVDFFAQFVVGGQETFALYLDAKRRDGCWGDDPEIEAICEFIVADDHTLALLRYKPGDLEDARIRQALRMQAERQPPSPAAGIAALRTPSSIALSHRHRAQQWQDADDTNAALEAQVLQLSQETARQREEADLETTLLLSLQQQQSKETAAAAPSLPSSSSTAASSKGGGGGGGGGGGYTMAQVKHLSEDEALRWAIAQSLESPSPVADAKPSSSSSLQSPRGYSDASKSTTAKATAAVAAPAAVSAMLPNIVDDEEAMLQQILAESLRSSSAATATATTTTTVAAATGPAAATTTAEASSFNAFHDFAAAAGFGDGDGDGGYDNDYDDDPDLLLAIQESLRK
eukprot:gene5692-4075_t